MVNKLPVFKEENHNIEFKSLKKAIGNKSNFDELAELAVCFANASGGTIFIGIENNTKEPPPNQEISQKDISKILTQLRSRTTGVRFGKAELKRHSNGGEFLAIKIFPGKGIATTSKGKVYIRIQDNCFPVHEDELTQLVFERNAYQWELVETDFTLKQVPDENIQQFVNDIKNSERVKSFVKQKDNIEILEHYNLVYHHKLTNLGVLWLGTPQMRARISYPLSVQYIVYDENENKVRKILWDDFSLNPKELILDIEDKTEELKYFYEIPNGLLRRQIRKFDAAIIRELLVNAIAHRKYTISGDIFIKVYGDKMIITNPGSLPLGITPENILHKTYRRNPHLMRILHDLGLMEGEGSGYDLIYEIASKEGKPFPVVETDFDSTTVTQGAKIVSPEVLAIMDFVDKHFQLNQKQLIALGIIAREKKILGTELIRLLQLSSKERLRSWVGKLEEEGIVISRGVKKGKAYLINPELIRSLNMDIRPTLKTIELYRLKALIESDLKNYPGSTISQIHQRLPDIDLKDLRKALYKMVEEEKIIASGSRKYRKYFLPESHKKNKNI